MKFLYLISSIFLLIAAGASFLVTQAATESPLVITLLSSAPGQTIAAGTEKVEMARYTIQGGDVDTPRVVKKIAVSFTGNRDGLTECSLLHGARKVHKGFIPLQLGAADIEFTPALKITGDEFMEFRLLCSIAETSIGKRYTWGIAKASLDSAISGTSAIAPQIVISRRPDGKSGVNGVTFTVVEPDMTLDAAEVSALALTTDTATITPKMVIEGNVFIKNSGGTTWTPGRYTLALSKNSDATYFATTSKSDSMTIMETVTPGQTAALAVSLMTPKDPGRYKVQFHLTRDGEAKTIIQSSEKTVLLIEAPTDTTAMQTPTTTPALSFLTRVSELLNIGRVQTSREESGGGDTTPSPDSAPGVATSNLSVHDSKTKANAEPVPLVPARPIVEYCEEADDAEAYCDE